MTEIKTDNKTSSVNDDNSVLISHDMKGISQYIKSGKCNKIAILAGAGISVSAGIPDFRSKGGFYKTLNIKRDYAKVCNMTEDQIKYCEYEETNILTIDLFKKNPACYCEARRPFIIAPMKYKATKTHWFFKTLYNKGLLKRFYSTNIDGLDSQCMFPDDVLIHVHGTLGRASCIVCGKDADMTWFRNEVYNRNYPIRCQYCNKPNNWVKPGTVLYGQNLPKQFHTLCKGGDLDDIDLIIIAGTSLSVFPSSGVPELVSKKCVRLLLNKDKVGYGYQWNKKGYNDVWYPGNCDDACNELIKLLGWDNDVITSMIGNVIKKSDVKQRIIKKLNNNDNIKMYYQNVTNNDTNDNNDDNLMNLPDVD